MTTKGSLRGLQILPTYCYCYLFLYILAARPSWATLWSKPWTSVAARGCFSSALVFCLKTFAPSANPDKLYGTWMNSLTVNTEQDQRWDKQEAVKSKQHSPAALNDPGTRGRVDVQELDWDWCLLAPEIIGRSFEDPFHGVPVGNSLAVNSKVEGKNKTNSAAQTIDWPSDMLAHRLVIHHRGLISRNKVPLQFMVPPLA